MRGLTRTVTMVAGISAVTLLAAACGGGSSNTGTSSSAGGKAGGTVTVRGCNPQNPLIPSNTTETCGGNVIDAVFAKLVHYDAETAKPTNDLAESIETTDNQNFTVKLKPGYKFQDGTEVKSKNFVDAWNYAAYGPNAQSSGYFMEPIEGFAEVHGDVETDSDTDRRRMKGVRALDDTSVEITLVRRQADFVRLLTTPLVTPVPRAAASSPRTASRRCTTSSRGGRCSRACAQRRNRARARAHHGRGVAGRSRPPDRDRGDEHPDGRDRLVRRRGVRGRRSLHHHSALADAHFEAAADKLTPSGLDFAAVDVDVVPDVVVEYGVRGIPAVKMFRNGQFVTDLARTPQTRTALSFINEINNN